MTTTSNTRDAILTDALLHRIETLVTDDLCPKSGSTARDMAKATSRLYGACDVLSVMGVGMTPTSALTAIYDAFGAVGTPPPAHSQDRRGWSDRLTEALRAALRDAI